MNYCVLFADINECESDKGGCEHTCVNTPGSFSCQCNAGYNLAGNKKSCTGKDMIVLCFFLHCEMQSKSLSTSSFSFYAYLKKWSLRNKKMQNQG